MEIGLVDDFDFDVKAVYVDREFDDGTCLTLLQAHNHAYVMPMVKWGTKIQTERSKGWRRDQSAHAERDSAAWNGLSVRRDVPVNKPPDDRWDAHHPDTPATAFICGRGAVSVPNIVRY